MRISLTMKKAVFALLLCFGIALCPLSSAKAFEGQSPLAFLEMFYNNPEQYAEIFTLPRQREQYFSKRIHKLAVMKEACFKQVFQMDHLDFNYMLPGNDIDLKNLSITPLNETTIDVGFNNVGEDIQLRYFFISQGAGWLIDDIRLKGQLLSDDLSSTCQAG